MLLLRYLSYVMGNPVFHATSSALPKEAYGESKYPVLEANKPNSHGV